MQLFINSTEDVHRQLINLNPSKSEIADEMHPKIRTSLACCLATPLAKLFNTSFETGIVPAEWKSSLIFPIYKKDRKNNATNYRPMCLTSVIWATTIQVKAL